MKKLILIVAAFALSGCTSLMKQQLEGKLARLEADTASVHASTIYGVSGTLVVKDLKSRGETTRAGEYHLQVDSPLATVKVDATNARLTVLEGGK